MSSLVLLLAQEPTCAKAEASLGVRALSHSPGQLVSERGEEEMIQVLMVVIIALGACVAWSWLLVRVLKLPLWGCLLGAMAFGLLMAFVLPLAILS